MLRGNFKTKLIYGGTLLTVFSLTIGSAWAGEIGTDTLAGASTLEGAKLTCNPQALEYTKIVPPSSQRVLDSIKYNACTTCQKAVEAQVKAIDLARNQAITQNTAVVGAGTAGTTAVAAATSGVQQVTQTNTGVTNNVGNNAQTQRAALAKTLAQAAQTCSQKVEESCKGALAAEDMKAKQAATQGCSQIASAATANATEKAASGMTMSDLSQMAGALGQVLGPLAQMMNQQKQGGDTGSNDPSNSGYSTPISTASGTSLGASSSQPSGTNVGNTNPGGAEFKNSKNNITGFTPSAASHFGPGSDGYASGSGYGDSSGGGTGMGSGSYSAGGGSAGLSSSGASMSPGDKDAEKAAAAAAAAAAEESYEVNAGGGGGGRPAFLGLKGRAEEDLGASGESVLGDLGLGEEGSRDLASADELSGGIGEAEGETLFHVIHTKISEIKKRGSI